MNIEDLQVGDIVEFWYIKYNQQIYANGRVVELKTESNEVVIDHPESLLNVSMIDTDSRNDKNEVEIDFRFKYLDEMMKYMANEYDNNELNGI